MRLCAENVLGMGVAVPVLANDCPTFEDLKTSDTLTCESEYPSTKYVHSIRDDGLLLGVAFDLGLVIEFNMVGPKGQKFGELFKYSDIYRTPN